MKTKVLLFFLVVLVSSHAFACKGKVGSEIGGCAPDFTLQTTDGRTFTLSDFQGKVVIVNFWATWCEPCIEELPSLNRLYQKKLSRVEFVSVSIDSDQTAIDRFFAMNKNIQVKFPILQDFQKKVADRWGTFKVPETYIIDKNGVVANKVVGVRDWEDTITTGYLELLAKQ